MTDRDRMRTAVCEGCFISEYSEYGQPWIEKFGNPPAFVRGRSFAIPVAVGRGRDVRLSILSGRILRKSREGYLVQLSSLRDWITGEEAPDMALVLGFEKNLRGNIPPFKGTATPEDPEKALSEKLKHIILPSTGVGRDFAELYINDWHYDFADTVPTDMTWDEWVEESKKTTTPSDVLSAISENSMKDAYYNQPARGLYLAALEARAGNEISLAEKEWKPDRFERERAAFEKSIGTVPLVLEERNSRPSDIHGSHPAICRISMVQVDGEGMVISKETPYGGSPKIIALSFAENRETERASIDRETFDELVGMMEQAAGARLESSVDFGGFHQEIAEMDYEAGISTRSTLVDPKSEQGEEILRRIKGVFERSHITTALDTFRAAASPGLIRSFLSR